MIGLEKHILYYHYGRYEPLEYAERHLEDLLKHLREDIPYMTLQEHHDRWCHYNHNHGFAIKHVHPHLPVYEFNGWDTILVREPLI